MNAEFIIRSDGFLSLSRHLCRQHHTFETDVNFTLDNGIEVTLYDLGIIEFCPPAATKDIVISSGIHGNETAPIEMCSDIVDDILSMTITPAQRALFIFGNLPAMDIAKRFVDENLNRLFSGAHSSGKGCSTPERERARVIERAITRFFDAGVGERYHYDLHTAIRASKNEKFAVYPYTDGRPRSHDQIRFLAACGVKTILLFGSAQSTLSYFSSSRFAAHAFTVELGKVKPFGQNDMSRFEEARVAIRSLICQSDVDFSNVSIDDVLIYKIHKDVIKHQHDFVLHFSDDTPNFADYPQGTLLASETGATVRADYDGEAIVFPNANVEIGQRALLTVIPSSLED